MDIFEAIDYVNRIAGEALTVNVDGSTYVLRNGSDFITEGDYSQVESAVKQFARDNAIHV